MEGKTLEQVSKNLKTIDTSFLVDFYNQYSGSKAIKKFKNRATAEERVGEMVKTMLKKKRESEAKSDGKTGFPPISPKAFTTLQTIRQCLKDWDDSSVSVEDMAIELQIPETSSKNLLDKFTQDGLMIFVKSEEEGEPDKYALSDLGKTIKYTLPKAGKSAEAKAASSSAGKKSSFSGKKIKLLVKDAWREGSKRHKDFHLMKDGMTFEQYKELGGHPSNFRWSVKFGYIKLS